MNLLTQEVHSPTPMAGIFVSSRRIHPPLRNCHRYDKSVTWMERDEQSQTNWDLEKSRNRQISRQEYFGL